MEHLIVDSTPRGSAILAYGQARGPGWNWKLFAVVAGSFLALTLAAAILMSNKLTLLMPQDRIVIAAIRPKTLASELSTELRQSLPPPWRAALETRSRFPAIFGVSLGPNDEPHAFALVARTNAILPSDVLQVTDNGLYRLLTDGEMNGFDNVNIQTVWSLSRRLRRHDAAWALDGSLFGRLAGAATAVANAGGTVARERRTGGAEVSSSDEVSGVWDGSRGRIFIGPENAREPAFDAPIFAILGNDRAAAVPAVSALASVGLDLGELTSLPELIVMTDSAPGGLFLKWPDRLEKDDLVTLRSALGLLDRRDLLLPDQTTIAEFVPASATMTVPFTVPVAENPRSTWEVTGFTLSGPSGTRAEAEPDPECPGQIRFMLKGQALENLLMNWKVPEIWKKTLSRLRIVETGQDVNVCLN